MSDLFDIIEEYLGDTENWELADDSTPDPTEAFAALAKLRAQYEALLTTARLIAKAALWSDKYPDSQDDWVYATTIIPSDVHSARAALRAAGLLEQSNHD